MLNTTNNTNNKQDKGQLKRFVQRDTQHQNNLQKDGYNQIKVRVYQEQGKIKADKKAEFERLLMQKWKDLNNK